MRSRVMRAPTTSWWWKRHAVVADRPGLRLADVVEQRGQAHDAARAGSWPPPRWCGPARPCGGGSGPARARMAGSSGRNSSARPVSTRNHRPGRRVVDDEQLVELVADPLGRHDLEPVAHARARAATSAGVGLEAVAGDEAGRPQHAQRVVGERLLGRQRRAQAPGGQVGRRRRTGRSARGSAAGARAMALTVKSRRDRSASTSSANDDVGLARVGRVGLGPVGGDLEDRGRPSRTPMVPKRSPWVHTASAQPGTSRLVVARGGRRW